MRKRILSGLRGRWVSDKKNLIYFLIIYLLIAIVFYPPFYTQHDEEAYIRQAIRFSRGEGLITTNPMGAEGIYYESENYYYFPWTPGNSLMLTPFVIFDWHYVFFAGIFLHILGFYLFYHLLKNLNLNTKFSLFYLFYPALIFYSRTAMSDLPATVAILGAIVFYTKKGRMNNFLSGVCFAIASFIRSLSLFIGIGFFISSLVRKEFRKGLLVFLPLIFITIIKLGINYFVFGNYLNNIMANETTFSILPEKIFSLFLLIFFGYDFSFMPYFFFPLSAVILFFYKGPLKKEITFSFVFYLLLLIYITTHQARHLLLLTPILLIPTIYFFSKIFKAKKYFSIMVVILVIFSGLISFLHYESSLKRYQLFQSVIRNVPQNAIIYGNLETALLFAGEEREVTLNRSLACLTGKEVFSVMVKNDIAERQDIFSRIRNQREIEITKIMCNRKEVIK
jgi:hypothetical protein